MMFSKVQTVAGAGPPVKTIAPEPPKQDTLQAPTSNPLLDAEQRNITNQMNSKV